MAPFFGRSTTRGVTLMEAAAGGGNLEVEWLAAESDKQANSAGPAESERMQFTVHEAARRGHVNVLKCLEKVDVAKLMYRHPNFSGRATSAEDLTTDPLDILRVICEYVSWCMISKGSSSMQK